MFSKPKSKDISQEVCRYGLKCTDGNCKRIHYHHVVESKSRSEIMCRYGKSCKYQDKPNSSGIVCEYKHPTCVAEEKSNPAEVSCRYDSNCTRANCAYGHSTPECVNGCLCPNMNICKDRHRIKKTICKHVVFNLPDGLTREDVCPQGNLCKNTSSCGHVIHMSIMDLVRKGFISYPKQLPPCGGWMEVIDSLGRPVKGPGCEYLHPECLFYLRMANGLEEPLE